MLQEPKGKGRRRACLILTSVLGPSLYKQSYGWVKLFIFIISKIKFYFRIIIFKFTEELQEHYRVLIYPYPSFLCH